MDFPKGLKIQLRNGHVACLDEFCPIVSICNSMSASIIDYDEEDTELTVRIYSCFKIKLESYYEVTIPLNPVCDLSNIECPINNQNVSCEIVSTTNTQDGIV